MGILHSWVFQFIIKIQHQEGFRCKIITSLVTQTPHC
uniref:Uncharacterized protein n=1 Tax=Brassica campestris TaxID=3711 RepID=A0A3P6A2C1_BRACM|nr:unnamed protein product [Brassica rapa]